MKILPVKIFNVKVTLFEPIINSPDMILGEYKSIVRENWIDSYFVSYGWMQAWLTQLPNCCKVYMVVVSNSKGPVSFFFMGLVTVTRGKLFRVKQLLLNATGHTEYDKIWIEYNSILCAPGSNLDLGAILKKIPLSWEEFCLPGLDCAAFPGNIVTDISLPYKFINDVSAVSPYVDLEKVRQADGGYFSLLSGNTRSKIRRSFKILEEIGSVELEVPDRLEHAFEIYREMVDLHQATWKARGQAGVFASQLFCRFHERLIRNRFDKGEIQLLRIHADGNTIGCLYSFLWQGCIYFYQCGFNYSFGKKVQPGLVSHVMAVQYNAKQGHDVYDFLAGDDRYKKSLSTDYNKMIWGRIQKVSWKLKLEEKLRGLFERFRNNKTG